MIRSTSRSESQLQANPSSGQIVSLTVDGGNISLPSFETISEMNNIDDPESPAASPVLVPSVPPSMKSSKYGTGQFRSPRPSPLSKRRVRAHSFNQQIHQVQDSRRLSLPSTIPHQQGQLDRQILLSDATVKAKSRDALRINDSMVYLDGPQVYTCAQCRTHMTSHDDIISKSFHGRHGRAYLFDQCVNVTIGPSEDRRLITGMHTVSDIFCKRCKSLVGWTYLKAYESSQKYKEGKYIIEKINLHLEESDYYTVAPPAGERPDRWRQRSMSWGTDVHNVGSTPHSQLQSPSDGDKSKVIYEYQPSTP